MGCDICDRDDHDLSEDEGFKIGWKDIFIYNKWVRVCPECGNKIKEEFQVS